jgi:hypothetical protein
MRIHTLEDKAFAMNEMPEKVDDVRFCILDNSNPQDPDYFFIPLIFLESFNAPALVIQLGKDRIMMPVDWHIVVGSPEVGDLEVLPLTSVNDRGFEAFLYNCLSGYMHEYREIDIVDIYTEVKWYFPKLKTGQLLAIPLNDDPKPQCAYFVSEINKQSEVIDVNQVM